MDDSIQVAVPIPGDEYYSYRVPEHLKEGIKLGKRVLVPFRNRKSIGFIVGLGNPPSDIKLKDILDIIDEEPLFDEKRLEFLRWISNYYIASLGIVLKAAHPGGLGVSLKRLITITENGINALNADRLTSHETLVLNTVYNFGEVTSQKLLTLVENTSNELLNSFKRRNLIEFSYELASDSKIKTEKIIVAGDGASLDSKSLQRKHAKAEILEYVLTHRKVTLVDLKEIFGNVVAHLPWLEEKEFIKIEHQEISRNPFSEIKVSNEPPPNLNLDQDIAYKKIVEAVSHEEFSPFLLHGVTGSGKTEVYLRAIGEVIKKGKEALVLVPEISLTPQLVKRFRSRFGNQVTVIHSALSDGERFDAWRMASRGEVKVVIGARSAIFAPLKNLGIIIVDEEHETSYKQEESPAYNARDLSLVLGRMTGSVVVLGSATPSVETYSNALKSRYGYLSMPLRVEDKSMPKIQVIDMKNENDTIFSEALKQSILNNFEENKQTILFLNRRGYSGLLICHACGEILKCPNCTVSLTYHAGDDSIKCHMCGLSEKSMPDCSKCGEHMRGLGIGTQKVEEEVKRILPKATVARMDRDTASGKNKLLKLYSRLERGEIDVLIGTQMVAKGHDLPGVTLVGVISADISLGIPDFRSGERTFQLVTQVAGRSGRGDHPGNVIVQTFNPEHPSITYATHQDSKGFLDEEIKLREELKYPPYSRLVNVRFSGRFEAETENVVSQSDKLARKMISKLPMGALEIIGPSPCPIYKIRNRFRFQMLLKSTNAGIIHSFSKQFLASISKISSNVRCSVDVDPYYFS
ncbi:MAG: primosomal protein N' [Thermodesulfobacteriota bacterium]|nr:MAG: primosomal protein N' [Thermodesulfobacteriota bacterium]